MLSPAVAGNIVMVPLPLPEMLPVKVSVPFASTVRLWLPIANVPLAIVMPPDAVSAVIKLVLALGVYPVMFIAPVIEVLPKTILPKADPMAVRSAEVTFKLPPELALT